MSRSWRSWRPMALQVKFVTVADRPATNSAAAVPYSPAHAHTWVYSICVFFLSFFIFWVQMASWNKKKREKFYLTLLSSIICQKGGKYKPALTPLVASVVERFQCNLHPHTDRQELQERERTTALLYTYIIIFIPNWFRKKARASRKYSLGGW